MVNALRQNSVRALAGADQPLIAGVRQHMQDRCNCTTCQAPVKNQVPLNALEGQPRDRGGRRIQHFFLVIWILRTGSCG